MKNTYNVSIHFLGRDYREPLKLAVKAQYRGEVLGLAIRKAFGKGRQQFGWHSEGGGRGYLTEPSSQYSSAVSIVSGLLRVDVAPCPKP